MLQKSAKFAEKIEIFCSEGSPRKIGKPNEPEPIGIPNPIALSKNPEPKTSEELCSTKFPNTKNFLDFLRNK